MKNFTIFSPYDCLLVSSAGQQFLQAGNYFEPECEKLAVYPLSERNFPSFFVDVSCDDESLYYKTVIDGDNKIVYLLDGFFCENFVCSSISTPSGDCTFKIGQNSFVFCCAQFEKHISLATKFSSYKTGSNGQLVYVLFSSTMLQDLYVFNCQNGKTWHLQGDEIKISHNKIYVSKTCDNVARQIEEAEFLLQSDVVEKEGCRIDYAEGRAVRVNAPQTVAYAFLDALSVGDAPLALTYLDTPLRRQLDEKALAEYFGTIVRFYAITPYRYTVFTATGYKIFNFVLNGNKIQEIGE